METRHNSDFVGKFLIIMYFYVCCILLLFISKNASLLFGMIEERHLPNLQLLLKNRLVKLQPSVVRDIKLNAVVLQRPAFCPIHHLTPSLTPQLSESTRDRGVDVGCALILESCDGRILLTRRAAHLRTFPGIWVPPGNRVVKHLSLSMVIRCIPFYAAF